jgi:uncharacterized protein YbjT (DUF2867 family)
MILVIGATGNIGRHVVAGLQARGHTVRALARVSAAALPDGVEVVTGDLTKPESLKPALVGVDAVFLLWPFLSADGVTPVVETIAGQAQRIVYVSALNAADDQTGVWAQVENAIRGTDLDWTFLRASGFATNTLEWAAAIRAGEPVRVPYPQAARSLIHERDIADVAVRALTEHGHSHATYQLTGPEAITQAEQVRVLSAEAGRPPRLVEIGADEARAGMLAWAGPEFADHALAYWASLVDAPELVTRTVEEVTGAPARTFEQWAHDHADDFR